jgi:PAS domain-containing protein
MEAAPAKVKEFDGELRMMIDKIPTLAWSRRPEGAIDFLNPRSSNYTGLCLDDALGCGWAATIHVDDWGNTTM